MFKLRFFVVIILSVVIAACAAGETVSAKTSYIWQNITKSAEFPQGYNYPVFVLNDRMLALNNGGWLSTDGRNWTKTALTESGLNSAYQKYVQLGEAVYALGSIKGNYLGFTISTKILRTRDGEKWESIAEKSNLPDRIFYGAATFKDKIWLIGGFDGKRYYNDVWNSTDGVNWTRAAERTDWSERNATRVVVFKDRLWLIGGGVIDGEKTNNPNSESEIWSSSDGINWTKSEVKGTGNLGGTPVVFDNKLWLVGANRSEGNFGSAVLVTDDGENWRELSAPWTPRGGSVVWVFGDKLFMTGGKYSFTENGTIKFVYSNDVWAMSKSIKN